MTRDDGRRRHHVESPPRGLSGAEPGVHGWLLRLKGRKVQGTRHVRLAVGHDSLLSPGIDWAS